MVDAATLFLRLVIVFLLSLLFGYQRQRSHKPIGFGTFIFVAIGSCALAIVAISLSSENPLTLLSGIVTGIGFLGAGALVKTTDKIFGFTTAASIWLFAIFGLVIGIGYYLTALLIYLLIWATLLVDHVLEKKGIGSYRRKIVLITSKIIPEKEIRETLDSEKVKHKLITIDVSKKDNFLSITYLVEGTREDIQRIPATLYQKPWFSSCKVE